MNLKSIIDNELKRREKTFKWLVGEVGVSNDGLKAGLEKVGEQLTADWSKKAGADGEAVIAAYKK